MFANKETTLLDTWGEMDLPSASKFDFVAVRTITMFQPGVTSVNILDFVIDFIMTKVFATIFRTAVFFDRYCHHYAAFCAIRVCVVISNQIIISCMAYSLHF